MIKKISFLGLLLLCLSSFPTLYAADSTPGVHLTASKQSSYELVLYVSPNCPYCKKVTSYLNSQKRTIPTKNTQDPGVRQELIRIGGKGQVPCLVINGKALYESDAIIEWLKNHP